MNSICFVANKYPSRIEPNANVFYQQLIWSIADLGIKCSVIAPVAIDLYPRYITFPYNTTETTENGNIVNVFWPKYFGLGDEHRLLGWSPARFTTHFFTAAVKRVVDREKLNNSDVFYGHFLEPAGVCAARMGKQYNKPSFVAYGEATFMSMECYGIAAMRKDYQSVTGVVAVSSQNKDMLIQKNIVPEEKIGVFPNGYRKERFYPRDKAKARERFGLPQDAFIVCFVGSFDQRKGVNRLSEALDNVENVYGIFAGKGDVRPHTKKTLWAEAVENKELPWFYSSADAFVLPTLHEGCCNAIVEALACGLPIISSNRRFNDDILDDSCSIRINPESIEEITGAIRTLSLNRTLCDTLSKGSIGKARQLTLTARAEKINEFIFQRANKQ